MDEYRIHVRDHTGNTFAVRLDRLPFWIGRGTENELVLNEPSVSKRHAYIARSGQGFAIFDNHSRNGVLLNNKERERIQQSRPLNPGDTFRIGLSVLKLHRVKTPEIPLHSSGKETFTFFPAQDAWDPLKSLGTQLGDATDTKADRARASSWQKLVPRLLLEASTSTICDLILDMIATEIPFDRCVILLAGKAPSTELTVVAQRLNKKVSTDFIISRQILAQVAHAKEGVLVSGEDHIQPPSHSFLRSGASTAICVPLIMGGKITGALYLDRLSSTEPLAAGDIESLGPIAGLIALKLENLQLVNEHIKAEVLRRDLELAKSIQESLLPQEVALLAGYSLEGFSIPCYQVGGDYFDFFSHGENKLTVVIGDVSGKGLSSALYMAGIRSSLHAHLEVGLDLSKLMSRLEHHTRSTFRSDHFLTLFVGTLERETGVLTYVNAGHMPAVALLPTGEVRELEATAPALNIAPWETFDYRDHQLVPGEILLLYTDGLVEAESSQGEQFGMDRLVQSLSRYKDAALAEIRRMILAEIETFADGAGPGDDRTLILLRRESS